MQKGMGIIGIVFTLCIIGFLFLYFTSKTTQQMTQETGFNLMKKTIGKTADASTKANINILRKSIAQYYNEQNGYPDSLDNSGSPPFIPTCLRVIPSANLGMNVPFELRTINKIVYGNTVTNTGGWLYNPYTGKIMVNYDGLDSEGINYTTY
ncbi:MAG: hypothetical protein QME42_11345 [bacterium]|nr:hypothetical protein [bacterium]